MYIDIYWKNFNVIRITKHAIVTNKSIYQTNTDTIYNTESESYEYAIEYCAHLFTNFHSETLFVLETDYLTYKDSQMHIEHLAQLFATHQDIINHIKPIVQEYIKSTKNSILQNIMQNSMDLAVQNEQSTIHLYSKSKYEKIKIKKYR